VCSCFFKKNEANFLKSNTEPIGSDFGEVLTRIKLSILKYYVNALLFDFHCLIMWLIKNSRCVLSSFWFYVGAI